MLRFYIFLATLKLIPTYLFNRLHRSHKYFVHFLSYFKIRIVASKRKPPLSSLIKRSLSTFLNKCLIVIQRETTLTLCDLSYSWRKRFVPGIICFVSLLTSQSFLKRVALFLFFLHSLHENPWFSKIPLLINFRLIYCIGG